jgi:hypothetical protein
MNPVDSEGRVNLHKAYLNGANLERADLRFADLVGANLSDALLVENLARDLGFHRRDLYRMVQFYRTYPIVTSLMSQLTWTHYTLLITLENPEQRRFYEVQTVRNAWSVRPLRQEITGQLYERTARTERLAVTTAAFLAPVEPEQAFRSEGVQKTPASPRSPHDHRPEPLNWT